VRLHQLLVILLDNALKYTSEHDSIGIKTYTEDQRVVIEVTDTGIELKMKT
jgi:two-component system, OmpR family, sensor histidine kinase CiaH